MKIVRRPVAIVSALSRVVDLTAVKRPISSLRESWGSLICPAAVEKTPPARLITEMRSSASTANLLETAFKAPNTCSDFEAEILNWAIAAISPSAVDFIVPKEGAKEDLATDRIEART